MKTYEAVQIYNGLKEFIKKDIELNVNLAWNIDTNCEELLKVCQRFEKHRDEIIRPLIDNKQAEIVEGNIKATKGNETVFRTAVQKVNEYLDTDNDVKIIKCDISELPSTLSVKDLEALKFMIKRDEN